MPGLADISSCGGAGAAAGLNCIQPIAPPASGTPATGGASGVTITSAMLVQEAMRRLAPPAPAVNLNPEGDQLVQLPSWLWLDSGQWVTRRATASAGGVSATVVADPQRVLWDMGNGDTVTCDGPGRPYAAEFAESPEATECRYTYRHSSASQPGASFEVTATIRWAASWSGSDGDGGDLGFLSTSASVPIRVQEAQALVQ